MLILIHWPSSDFTVPHTRHFAWHTQDSCVLWKRTRNARAMKQLGELFHDHEMVRNVTYENLWDNLGMSDIKNTISSFFVKVSSSSYWYQTDWPKGVNYEVHVYLCFSFLEKVIFNRRHWSYYKLTLFVYIWNCLLNQNMYTNMRSVYCLLVLKWPIISMILGTMNFSDFDSKIGYNKHWMTEIYSLSPVGCPFIVNRSFFPLVN